MSDRARRVTGTVTGDRGEASRAGSQRVDITLDLEGCDTAVYAYLLTNGHWMIHTAPKNGGIATDVHTGRLPVD